MSHFAEIDANDTVLRVVVGDNAMTDSEALAWCETNLGGRWVQTSYNASIRKNLAGVGYSYDESRDAFIPPRPYPSWVLDEQTCLWMAPVSRPQDGGPYDWDDVAQAWVPAGGAS